MDFFVFERARNFYFISMSSQARKQKRLVVKQQKKDKKDKKKLACEEKFFYFRFEASPYRKHVEQQKKR